MKREKKLTIGEAIKIYHGCPGDGTFSCRECRISERICNYINAIERLLTKRGLKD